MVINNKPSERATTTANRRGATIGSFNANKTNRKRRQMSEWDYVSCRVCDSQACTLHERRVFLFLFLLLLLLPFFPPPPPLRIPPITELVVDPRCLERRAAACRVSYRGCRAAAAAAAPRTAAARRISSSRASRGKTSSLLPVQKKNK